MIVTLFSRCGKTKPVGTDDILNILNDIKGAKWQHHRLALKNLSGDDKAQRQYKTNKMEAIAFNGEFSYRANANLIQHNGLATLDFDHCDGAELKEKIKQDKHVFSAFISPRGGLKVLIRMPIVDNDDEYKKILAQIHKHYKIYGVKSDKSCKDIARLTFVSSDPELYINKKAQIFQPEEGSEQESLSEEPKKEENISEEPKEKESQPENTFEYKGSHVNRHLKTALWVEDFLLDYCLNNPLPEGGRHHFIEKNLVAFTHDRDDYQKIKNQYINLHRQGQDTLKTWENAIRKGKYIQVSPGELAAYIKDNKEIQYKPLSNQMLKDNTSPEAEVLSFDPQNVGQLLKNPPEPPKYVIDKVLPEGAVIFASGAPGDFKTWNALFTAVAIQTKKEYLSTYPIKKSNVLYIDEENSLNRVLFKINKILNGLNLTYKDIQGFHISSFQGLKINQKEKFQANKNQPFIDALVDFIKKNVIKVVFLDSLVRLICGEENSSSDMKSVFDTLKDIIMQTGVSFWVLHHHGKSANGSHFNSMRGSSDLPAMASVIYTFKATKNKVVVNCSKHRELDKEHYPDISFWINDSDEDSDGNYQAIHFNKLLEQAKINVTEEIAEEILDHLNVKNMIKFRNKDLYNFVVKEKGYAEKEFYSALKAGVSNGLWVFSNGKDGRKGYEVLRE